MVPVVVFSDAFMSHVEQKVGSQARSPGMQGRGSQGSSTIEEPKAGES